MINLLFGDAMNGMQDNTAINNIMVAEAQASEENLDGSSYGSIDLGQIKGVYAGALDAEADFEDDDYGHDPDYDDYYDDDDAEECWECDGSGEDEDGDECHRCDGHGYIY